MGELKKKKIRLWLKITGAVLGLILIVGGCWVYSIWNSLNKTVDTMYIPVERETEKRPDALILTEKEPFSVLLLGVDERENDSGRSDTMIVLTVNPTLESIKMLSIPRDTRATIIGKNKEDKINHAYAFGGTTMTMDTVENFLDIPIDYYVNINMEGFQDIVNAVGGITVDNTFDFTSYGVHFAKGTLDLDGANALTYSRMRYEDPNGDFGRQERQRQIVEGVLAKGASVSSLTNYRDIFNALGNNIQTNLSFDEIMDIQRNYRTAIGKVEEMSIAGEGTKMDGIYYYLVPEEEKQNIQNSLKEHLSLSNNEEQRL